MAARSSGALGSAGALLEVSYPGTEGRTCRGVWRFREGRLARLPVRGPEGPLPDCLEPGWSYRWERPDQKAPALYVRERSLATPDGVANDVEVYVFTGFELAFTPASSHREIRGVPIPPWPDVVFYPRMALEDTLSSRFGLSRLRELPRLRILASQADRLFELRIEDPSGRTQTFPVCRATRGPARPSDVPRARNGASAPEHGGAPGADPPRCRLAGRRPTARAAPDSREALLP
jgi:hypothetical protein